MRALTPRSTFHGVADMPYGYGDRHVFDVSMPVHCTVGVFFYGGGWQSGDRADYLFVGEALASRGFVEDAAQAVGWAREHAVAFGGDPGRIFLMGHSAGAQIATLLATDDRFLAAQGFGKRDIGGVIGLAGRYDFLPLRNETLKRIFRLRWATTIRPPIPTVWRRACERWAIPSRSSAIRASVMRCWWGRLGRRSGRSRRCWMMWRHLSRSTDARRVSRLPYGPPRITPGFRLAEP
jgi:pimeloyl-ACP methyl ester carboxylesterase